MRLCFVFVPAILCQIGSTESTEESEESNEPVWECGTDEFTKYISENQIDIDCPALKKSVNQCCYVHDACYDDQLGRKHCDDTFCACLATVTAPSVLCHKEDSPLFCGLVREFGADAYRASGNGTNNGTLVDELVSNSTDTNTTTRLPTNDYDYESAVSANETLHDSKKLNHHSDKITRIINGTGH